MMASPFTQPAPRPQAVTVTLVIVTYNGKRWIDELLASIKSQDYLHIVTVLVDNDSHDGCLLHVQQNYPWVRTISAGGNIGFGAAANLGASAANSDLLAFLNEDMRLEKSAIRYLVEHFNRLAESTQVGIISAKEVGYFNPHSLQNLGWKLDWLGFTRASLEPPMAGPAGSTFFYAPGAPCLIRTNLFIEAGGFEELFFLYYEDTDLSWKVRLLGYDIQACDEAIVYHVGGAATAARPTFSRVALMQRNRLLLLWKNYSLPRALLVSIIAIPHLLFFAMLYALTEFGPSYFTTTCGAVLAAIRLIPEVRSRRRFIQTRRRISDRTLCLAMSARYLGPSLFAGAFRLWHKHFRLPPSPYTQ